MDAQQQTFSSLAQLVSEQLGVGQEAISGNVTWMELGADSLDRMAISLAIEDKFCVEIPHQVGEHLNTVGDTLEHLCGLLTAQRALREQATLRRESSAPSVAALTNEHPNTQGAELLSKQQLLSSLGQMITDQLGVGPEWITKNATWLELGADSLDRLAISLAIEDTFHVDIPHQVGERLNTVGDTFDHVWGLVAAKSVFPGLADGYAYPGGSQA